MFEALQEILAAFLGASLRSGIACPANTIVFLIIAWFLDVVPPDHGCVSMLVVAFPFDEIDLSKELLLVML